MASRKKNIIFDLSLGKRAALAVRLLAMGVLGLSCYLAWVSLGGDSIAGCGPNSSCHEVLNSRWAYWFNIPVSLIALIIYLALFGATFFLGPGHSNKTQQNAWGLLLSISIILAGAAAWFMGVQFVLIKRFCPFCVTAHVFGLAIAIILVLHAPLQRLTNQDRRQNGSFGFDAPKLLQLSLFGILALVVLAGGQILGSKPGFLVQPHAGKSAMPALPSPGTPSIQRESNTLNEARLQPPQARNLSIHNGQFILNLMEVPLIGSPAAPNIMVSLFDYTCHHCRTMHEHLTQARTRFESQLAIVSLPMPLDANCNFLVKRTPQKHENACEYARLALGVWRANRNVFPQFDSWLFSPSSPPSLEEARKHAAQLAGENALEKALSDNWIKDQLQQDIAIYQANSRSARSGQMPQLIVGGSISIGQLRGVENLFQMLDEQFGLK